MYYDHVNIRMKYIFIATIFALALVTPDSAAGPEKHLFILSGQSNMVGLEPSISFTPAVEAVFGKDHVIVVKDAEGRKSIRRWYKNWKQVKGDQPEEIGDLYDRLMTKIHTAINGKEIETVTFIWMQGEKDANRKHGGVYAESLMGLIKQLRDDLGRKDINFVIGRLSDHGLNKKESHWQVVRRVQVEVAEADLRGAWVDTDDLNDGKYKKGKQVKNDLHYSADGYKILGKRFAEKAIALINNNKVQ